uniref:Uncharacterized protein n=1 Tax=Panagrolaimus superbus TaxID=310955 RepID=A0A914YW94_9BILA
MLKREAEFFSLQDFEKLLDHLLEKQINSLQEYPRQSQINEEMLELLRKMSHQQVAASYNHNNSSISNNNHMGLTQVNGIYR